MSEYTPLGPLFSSPAPAVARGPLPRSEGDGAALGVSREPLAPGHPHEPAFWRWFDRNQSLVRSIVAFAVDASRRGRRVGMRLCIERARWEHAVEREQTDETFAINDHVAPLLARWCDREVPELAGFFELRDRPGRDGP